MLFPAIKGLLLQLIEQDCLIIVAISKGVQDMFDLVIEIRGGVLVGVYTRRNNVSVAVIDWDNESYGSPASFGCPSRMAEIPMETQRAITSLGVNITDSHTTI